MGRTADFYDAIQVPIQPVFNNQVQQQVAA